MPSNYDWDPDDVDSEESDYSCSSCILIDNGSDTIKYSNANANEPKLMPNVVLSHHGEKYIGQDAIKMYNSPNVGNMDKFLSYPTKNGNYINRKRSLFCLKIFFNIFKIKHVCRRLQE